MTMVDVLILILKMYMYIKTLSQHYVQDVALFVFTRLLFMHFLCLLIYFFCLFCYVGDNSSA